MFGLNNDLLCTDLPQEIKNEKKYISKFFFIFISVYFFIYALVVVCALFVSDIAESKRVINIIVNFLSELVVPLLFLITAKLTKGLKSPKHPVMDKMSPKKFVQLLAVSVFVMIAGAYISTGFATVIQKIFGYTPDNIINDVLSEMYMWEIVLYTIIVAPIFEELLFRKLIIDKFSKYGTSFCVGVSAFVFALIHANMYQFFYALGVGVLLGYVYCIYGNIIYSVIIHALLNAMGVIIPILSTYNESSYILLALISLELIMVIFGGILFACRYFKKEKRLLVDGLLINPQKVLFGSAGFWTVVLIFALKLIYRLSSH